MCGIIFQKIRLNDFSKQRGLGIVLKNILTKTKIEWSSWLNKRDKYKNYDIEMTMKVFLNNDKLDST